MFPNTLIQHDRLKYSKKLESHRCKAQNESECSHPKKRPTVRAVLI